MRTWTIPPQLLLRYGIERVSDVYTSEPAKFDSNGWLSLHGNPTRDVTSCSLWRGPSEASRNIEK